MDIYPDMYQIFKHPTKKNRRRVVIKDRELQEVFELNMAVGSCALFMRKLPSGQSRPYSTQEEFCNSEELGSIINVYEEVARDVKRYWNILNAVFIGRSVIAEAQDGSQAFQQALESYTDQHPDVDAYVEPVQEKIEENDKLDQDWVEELAKKLPEPKNKKRSVKRLGKKDICWTTLEEAKKIIGNKKPEPIGAVQNSPSAEEIVRVAKEKIKPGEWGSGDLKVRQALCKQLGWEPKHGAACGTPNEPCSCDPAEDGWTYDNQTDKFVAPGKKPKKAVLRSAKEIIKHIKEKVKQHNDRHGSCGHCYQDEFDPECPVHGKRVLRKGEDYEE